MLSTPADLLTPYTPWRWGSPVHASNLRRLKFLSNCIEESALLSMCAPSW
jgi:hypothetical protein